LSGPEALPQGVYIPYRDYHGIDTFSIRLGDGTAFTAPLLVTIAIGAVNDPPVAVPDQFTTPHSTALRLVARDLLANDYDVDGDALAITAVAAISQGGMNISFTDGQLVYQTSANYSGNDQFSYTLSDGHGGEAMGVVTVTVEPPPPVPSNDEGDGNGRCGAGSGLSALIISAWLLFLFRFQAFRHSASHVVMRPRSRQE
jgi:hypothetical protein